jgi:transcriptional antiterminator Rof (Rho-off)
MTDYTPIACSSYDVLEIAIMARRRLAARWREADGTPREGTLTPLDLRVRNGAEWLVARDAQGADLALRLDRLESARPLGS